MTSVSPLKVQVDQKLELTAAQLILTNAVRDYTVYMTVDHQTENTAGGSGDASFASHKHAYKGKKAFKVHLGLKAGEQVLLLRTRRRAEVYYHRQSGGAYMIPKVDNDLLTLEVETQPSLTYALDIEHGRIRGMVDELGVC